MSVDPEIHIDLNSATTERGYALVRGSLEDLAKLDLTPATAVGRRFCFVQPDADENGRTGAYIFNGTVAQHPHFGFLAYADESGVRWRAQGDA